MSKLLIASFAAIVLAHACDPEPTPTDPPPPVVVDAGAEMCVSDEPTAMYVGMGEECARIRFSCEEGHEYFSDDCGCGCRAERCRADGYVSDSPEECRALFFRCDPGYRPFFDDCGCGCEPDPTSTF